MSPSAELPQFTGRLLDHFEDWHDRLRAFLRLQAPDASEEQKQGWLLLSLPPGSAAAEALKSVPKECSFDETVAHLHSRFNNPTTKKLARSAACNRLKLRHFRDAQHPYELVSSVLDEVNHYGCLLALSDADIRVALISSVQLLSLLIYAFPPALSLVAAAFLTFRKALMLLEVVVVADINLHFQKCMQQVAGQNFNL